MRCNFQLKFKKEKKGKKKKEKYKSSKAKVETQIPVFQISAWQNWTQHKCELFQLLFVIFRIAYFHFKTYIHALKICTRYFLLAPQSNLRGLSFQ